MIADKKPLPKGFICPKCDQFNPFATYVYAHWSIDIVFTCECGQKFLIFEGVAEFYDH